LPKKFGLATLLLVTTFVQMACIFLAPSHVPQYQAFHTTCTSNLMYNLSLIHWQKARKIARQCRMPMTKSIVILILSGKKYCCVLTAQIKV